MSTLNEIQATTDFSAVLPLSSKSTHNAVFSPIFDATLFVMLKVVHNLEQSKKSTVADKGISIFLPLRLCPSDLSLPISN